MLNKLALLSLSGVEKSKIGEGGKCGREGVEKNPSKQLKPGL